MFDFGYRRHSDQFILVREDPSIYENNHVTDSWQAALRRHDDVAQNTRISYGAEGYRDEIDSNNLGHHGRNRGAIYAAVDFRALRRFSVSLGTREESYNGARGQFTPSASTAYWISSSFKVRGAVSRAFRIPTYTDLYYSDPANVGNPNLRPESAWSYEGGFDWNSGGRVSVSATGCRLRALAEWLHRSLRGARSKLRNCRHSRRCDFVGRRFADIHSAPRPPWGDPSRRD